VFYQSSLFFRNWIFAWGRKFTILPLPQEVVHDLSKRRVFVEQFLLEAALYVVLDP